MSLTSRRDVFRFVVVVWLTSRFLVWIAGYTGYVMFVGHPEHVDMVAGLQGISWMGQWDGGWYNAIIGEGYRYEAGKESSVAFFPLYPLLVKGLMVMTGNATITGIVMNHLLFFVALYLFVRLLKKKCVGDEATMAATWLLAVYPGAMYFSFHYTESLYLTLVLAVFYFCEKGVIKYAVPFAILASATRVTGAITWGIVGLYWMRECGWRPGVRDVVGDYRRIALKMCERWGTTALVLLCPLGLMAYMWYLYTEFGDPLVFLKAQAGWGREQWGTVYVLIKNILAVGEAVFLKGELDIKMLRRAYELLFTLIALFAAVKVWKKLGPEYALYVIVSLLLATSSAITSNIRYVAVLFPVFIYLGMVLPAYLRIPAYLCFAAIGAVFATMFANTYFIG